MGVGDGGFVVASLLGSTSDDEGGLGRLARVVLCIYIEQFLEGVASTLVRAAWCIEVNKQDKKGILFRWTCRFRLTLLFPLHHWLPIFLFFLRCLLGSLSH